MNNRNIPYSKEAEQSVLGSAFLSKVALQKVCDELITEDFYLESHQKIFDVLKELNSEGLPVDITILTDRLENAKEFVVTDEVLQEILRTDKELAKEYRKMKKFHDDPRITKVGRFIRRTSIDELPQLINIFMGDMSFIGNRPYLPREKKDMGEYYDEIVKTKPGLTGFWQASLRSRGTFLDRLKMEKYYSNNYSLKFDISIFFKTLSTLFDKESAK